MSERLRSLGGIRCFYLMAGDHAALGGIELVLVSEPRVARINRYEA